MVHEDHVRLIRRGIPEPGGAWVDIGSGTGAFTLALADVLGPSGTIYSVDKDARSLAVQRQAFADQFPGTDIHFLQQDFTENLAVPQLDGILAANSLHYVEDKLPVLKQLKSYLKENGRLIVVEYNVDVGNYWVPFPFSYQTLEKLMLEAGFARTKLLGSIPSQFMNEIYSAVIQTSPLPAGRQG